MSFELVCSLCSARHDASRYRLYCETCGGLLEVEYAAFGSRLNVFDGAPGLGRFGPLLPIANPANFVTLGEGNTPTILLPRLAAALGLDRLYGKLEFQNPTGSFKDRGNAVQVSVLKELGISEVVDVTIGNAGHSFAAYCARAGIRCIGIVTEGTLDQNTLAAGFLGAELHRVAGDRQARFNAARAHCEANGLLFMNYGMNSYFIEGQKTMAYEVAVQTDPAPVHILAPAGNGSIVLGLWRGFRDMIADGRVSRMPRLHAVQTHETQPIVAAFQGREWQPGPDSLRSVAVGIGIPNPPRLAAVARACRETGGQAIAVAEGDILVWQRRLAELEGLLVEPTTAVTLAAAQTLIETGVIQPGEPVLLPLTGSGLKEPIPPAD